MTPRAFTLVELMIVMAILGLLATLIVPKFQSVRADAENELARVQLQTIRSAVQTFVADTAADRKAEKLQDLADYALWPLMRAEHPMQERRTDTAYTYADFNPLLGIGRRGTGYLPLSLDEKDGTFFLRDAGNRTYFLVYPNLNGADSAEKCRRLKKMMIVWPGKDGICQTDATYFDAAEQNFNYTKMNTNDDSALPLFGTPETGGLK